ncbi:MAG TPA: DNA-directed RNA polymerase subunit beta [Candidatus Ornithoclostridium faecigallinarum]|nr:DNA-directed RNA polymerase subunit beta [Candidatus Ornithoclostridium faecigallinarum]
MPQHIHKVKYGNTERLCFSRIKETLPIPYLIALQKDSYRQFVTEGIKEVLDDFSPVRDYAGRMELQFLGFSLEGTPKYDVKECKERDATYSLPLKVKVRLVHTDTGEATVEEVFMGDFPLMTENGSFIINGAERVVVSQLVRSPGVYSGVTIDRAGVPRYDTTVMPSRGAWLEFKQDSNNILWVSVDRTRKITATMFLRALGFGTDEELIALFGSEEILLATLAKDAIKNSEDAKIELYKRMKQGEIPTIDGINQLIRNTFYDSHRYDFMRVGRYKVNKKLCFATRLAGNALADNIVDEQTGEILAEKGSVLTEEQAVAIQNAGVNVAHIVTKRGDTFKLIGNNTVDLAAYVDCDPKELGILEKVYYPKLAELLAKKEAEGLSDEAFKDAIKESRDELVIKHVTIDDIIAAVNYNLGLVHGLGETDNIDHLANRRVKAVGELLQNQFRIGMARLDRVIKERMSITQDIADHKVQSFINIKPVTSVIKEFFGSSQLSQFMDHHNPIAELTHKRKLSALGPGGLSRDRASFEVRDINHSHYGRLCPIETPEGQNIGLISSLATYARVNEYGFIEAPYRKVDKVYGEDGSVVDVIVSDRVEYLQADEEDKYVVAQANEPLTEDGHFVDDRVTCRIREDIRAVDKKTVDYMDVSPKQLVSVAASLVPFLENDDTSRALMGSNMQRQAVPLLRPEAPIIATGIEHKIAYDSGVMVIAKNDGVVKTVDAARITVEKSDGDVDVYKLQKFERSNNGTCINQRPIVTVGQKVIKGMVLADGPATDNGELSLGRNILIGYMSWEGYNYEDAILISEDLVKDDVFTSIHIEEYEVESRDTRLGEEQITRDIPNLGDDALKYLDEDGIIMIGAEVHSGDILVGRVTPKGETELTPEERLLRAIFGEKAREVRDTSLRVPHGQSGIVVDVKVFTRENKDELPPGVTKLIRVYVAQKRKLGVGDKMAGRHGNKGVVSRVLPKEDMPFMADGTPLQIVLNPMGVPSRMNIGQVLEVHLGFVAKMLDWKISTPVFDGAKEADIKELFAQNNLPASGKMELFDGRTGEKFENPVTVGYMYMLKLIHLVDDKIHARSTGPYSLVTQQPLGGKAQFGGQRFGEMEVWALEAYGASHVLQEILTVKSDDVVGRVKTYESIVKGAPITEPGTPESFKVLIKEFQALGLDVKVLNENKEEIGLRENVDEEIDYVPEKEQELDEVDAFALNEDDNPYGLGSGDSMFDYNALFDDADEAGFGFGDDSDDN